MQLSAAHESTVPRTSLFRLTYKYRVSGIEFKFRTARRSTEPTNPDRAVSKAVVGRSKPVSNPANSSQVRVDSRVTRTRSRVSSSRSVKF